MRGRHTRESVPHEQNQEVDLDSDSHSDHSDDHAVGCASLRAVSVCFYLGAGVLNMLISCAFLPSNDGRGPWSDGFPTCAASVRRSAISKTMDGFSLDFRYNIVAPALVCHRLYLFVQRD